MSDSNRNSVQMEEAHPVCLSGQSAICRMCLLTSANAKETLAEVQESTEQRMHSVADLIPQKEEEIHERADRLSDSAQEHYRRVERRRADDGNEQDD
jgi:hypothetical protein